MSRVNQAFQQVDRDSFVLREDGSIVIQSTANSGIKQGLETLDVQEGNRVLEIGTGSGFSTALISNLVGTNGRVVSLDIEPEMTERARKMFKHKNITNVYFETKDGTEGLASEMPYDRIIAWTTPKYLPSAWMKQVAEGGYILAPFRILPLADCMVMVRFKREEGLLKGGDVTEGSYIPMTSEPVKEFFGHEVHAQIVGEGEEPFWASSDWMKENPNEVWKEKFLYIKPQPAPFQEDGRAIRAYLLGRHPDGLTTAFHPDYGFWIGYSSPNGFALISKHENQWIVSDEVHASILEKWYKDWFKLDKPSYDHLEAQLIGNKVKVNLKHN